LRADSGNVAGKLQFQKQEMPCTDTTYINSLSITVCVELAAIKRKGAEIKLNAGEALLLSI